MAPCLFASRAGNKPRPRTPPALVGKRTALARPSVAVEIVVGSLLHRRHHDAVEQRRPRGRRSVRFVGRAGSAQYLIGRDAALRARKLVAAERPSSALEDTVPRHRLSIGSRCRSGRAKRLANVLLWIGPPRALSAMAATAAMAKAPLLSKSGIGNPRACGGFRFSPAIREPRPSMSWGMPRRGLGNPCQQGQ
jgi:hypothetical protein